MKRRHCILGSSRACDVLSRDDAGVDVTKACTVAQVRERKARARSAGSLDCDAGTLTT